MKSIAFIALGIVMSISCMAQNQLLQTKVSLHHRDIAIVDAIKVLQLKYGIPFSYSSSTIPANKRIQLYLKQVPLDFALKTIFLDTDIGYEVIGNQIVLRKVYVPKPQGKMSTKSKTVSTIKIPENTSLHADTKVIPPDSVKPDTTLKISSLPQPQLEVPKAIVDSSAQEAALDSVYEEERTKMKRKLSILKDSLKSKSKVTVRQLDVLFEDLEEELRQDYYRLRDSIRNNDKDFLPLPKSSTLKKHQQADSVNREYAHRKAQTSFVYPVGSNGHESPYFINNASLNVIAGYNGGVEGIEIGGVANINRYKVQGFQAAGVVNVTGNDVTGAQVAGFANINNARTSGFQAAGFMNMVKESNNGIQAAGFMNVNGTHCKGLQAAGFMNVNGGNGICTQAAGFMNVNNGKTTGSQVAGFSNISRRDMNGFQAAGFMNFTAGTINGVQASGFLNAARKLNGTQIGIFNYADTVSKGIPIGLFSFVRKGGMHSVDIFTSETFQSNITFKTGVKRFYNILYAGYQFRPSGYRWSYGYGVGTEVRIGKRWFSDFDALAMHVNENEAHTNQLNLNVRFQPTIGFNFSKNVGLFVGPQFNLLISDYKDGEGNPSTLPIRKISENNFYHDTFYWGITAGLRFF